LKYKNWSLLLNKHHFYVSKLVEKIAENYEKREKLFENLYEPTFF